MIRSPILPALVLIAAFGGAAGAQTPSPAMPSPSMRGMTLPDPGAKADPDMAKVLDALVDLGGKPIETLTAAEARTQPGAADAVAKVVKDEKIRWNPHAGLTVTDSRFADLGNLRLRWYVPQAQTKGAPLPVVIYFRGGGWVVGDLDSYDASASALARKTGAALVSVDYPMAPEHRFPAAHDEAIAAYDYVLRNAKGWGYDPARIAIVGESAGGNLAVATAIAARDRKLAMPAAIVAIYPVATTAMDTPSKRQDADAKPLGTATMAWFLKTALADDAQRSDPRLDLVSANLRGLPPVTIVNAGIDPLRSDGEMLALRLAESGVPTTHTVFSGVTHEFFGMDAVVVKAKLAQDFVAAQILKGFGRPVGTTRTP